MVNECTCYISGGNQYHVEMRGRWGSGNASLIRLYISKDANSEEISHAGICGKEQSKEREQVWKSWGNCRDYIFMHKKILWRL
jgi:hypothetical protein